MMQVHQLLNPALCMTCERPTLSWLQAQKWVVAIGNFDGVHLGHQALVCALQAQATALGANTAVLLFEPQPMEFFRGPDAPIRLMGWRSKAECLFALGIDLVLIARFSQALAVLSPNDFMTELRQRTPLAGLTLGRDFRFGARRQGDVQFLSEYCAREGIDLRVMPDFGANNQRVSSSLVRSSIEGHDFKKAQEQMGCPYVIWGHVVRGQQLARQLGFPTANLKTALPVPPIHGVFVGWVHLPYNGADFSFRGCFKAIANCGWRPTVNGRGWQVEIHILDDQYRGEAIYGATLGFQPLKMLRPEQKFESINQLQVQIEKDVAHARVYFDER